LLSKLIGSKNKQKMPKIIITRKVEDQEEVDIEFPLYRWIQDDFDELSNCEIKEILMLTEDFVITVTMKSHVIEDSIEYDIEHEEINNVVPSYLCYLDKPMARKEQFQLLMRKAMKALGERAGLGGIFVT